MFYEAIRTKQDHSYISICSLSILYYSKFILMATSLGTNAHVVPRVHSISMNAGFHSAVGSASGCRSRGREVEPQLGHITFVDIDYEIISTSFLSLPLILEGLLSVTDESLYTVLVNRIDDYMYMYMKACQGTDHTRHDLDGFTGPQLKTKTYKHKHYDETKYSRTSVARTPMARLPWLIRTRF